MEPSRETCNEATSGRGEREGGRGRERGFERERERGRGTRRGEAVGSGMLCFSAVSAFFDPIRRWDFTFESVCATFSVFCFGHSFEQAYNITFTFYIFTFLVSVFLF